jgi:hypothetical protein
MLVVMTKRGARSSSRLIKPGEEFRSQRGLFFLDEIWASNVVGLMSSTK